MDANLVRQEIERGKTPRRIAREHGYGRVDVEDIATRLKAERRARLLRRLAVLLFAVATLITVPVILYEITREPTEMEFATKITDVADSLLTNSSQNPWFIEKEWAPGTLPSVDMIAMIEGLSGRLNRTLEKNAGIPEVANMRRLFGNHLFPTVFSTVGSGISMSWHGGAGDLDIERMRQNPNALEVVFYGHGAFTHPKVMRRLLFYDIEWRALFIAALQYADDAWFDAMIIHELHHAKMHRGGQESATAPMLSDPWVQEEVDAHELERGVLDLRTNGAYAERLREVVDRRPAQNLQGFLARITREDVAGLDGLFQPPLLEERDTRVAQYYLNLACAWLEKRHQGEELQREKMEAYRLLISPFGYIGPQ